MREAIFVENIPETIMLSPEIAFFLTADHQTYAAMMKKATASLDNIANNALKGMANDAAMSIAHPTAILNWAIHLGKGMKGIVDHMDAMQQADSARSLIASSVLEAYKVTEIAPSIYVLKRAKWDWEIEPWAGGTTRWVPKLKENGIDGSLDFQTLKRKVAPQKSRGE